MSKRNLTNKLKNSEFSKNNQRLLSKISSGLVKKVSRGALYTAMFATPFLYSGEAKAEDLLVPSQYDTIQEAIDDANDGDRILISPGTYGVVSSTSAPYVAKISGISNLTIEGNGDDSLLYKINPNREGRGFFINQNSNNIILRNLTIENGKAFGNYFYSTNPYDGPPESRLAGGAGILIDNSGTIESIKIENCNFYDNFSSDNLPGSLLADGGAIDVINNSVADISNCEIKNNTATHSGGGIHSYNSIINVDSCIIDGNLGMRSTSGGGIALENNSSAEINNNYITNNIAWYLDNNKGGFGGGILSTGSSDSSIKNNVIMYNSTEYNGDWNIYGGEGAGVFIWDGTPPITITANNTIRENNIGNTNLRRNITIRPNFTSYIYNVYNNNIEDWDLLSALGSTLPRSISVPSPDENIDADPLFVDIANGDFRLQSTSPNIDAGTTYLMSNHDFFGNPRPVDGNIPADGIAMPDIGAHEYQPPATATPTPTETSTNSPTPTITNTYTPTITNTPTWTETFTPIPTDTNTATPTETFTSIPTDTNTPTPTNTPTFTATETNTPIDTFTPTPTSTKFMSISGIARNMEATPLPGYDSCMVIDENNDGTLDELCFTDGEAEITSSTGFFRVKRPIEEAWIGNQVGVMINGELGFPTTAVLNGHYDLDVQIEDPTSIEEWMEY